MYEIHIVTNKNYPKEGYRVDKETYEKYGLPVSLKKSKNEIDVNDNLTQVGYSDIEEILFRFCSFMYSMNHNFKNPIANATSQYYVWTLPENEIINIAAKYGIKIVFEDQLSLKTDFLNQANTLDVTLIDGYYDEEWNEYGYTVIPDYAAHKAAQQAENESYESIRPENYDAGNRIHQALLALGGTTGWECWDITFRHAVNDEFIKRAKTKHNLNLSVKDTNIVRNKFKMYFVKTDKPNVFRRIDELGRILFNKDIYPMEDALSKKQNAYIKKSGDTGPLVLKEIIDFTDNGHAVFDQDDYPVEQAYAETSCDVSFPSWKEVIGFTDNNGIVTIHKSYDEMIQTANKQFDIDLCFVDTEPNITYDPNVMIDVELQDDGDDDNCWYVTFGKYDKTDILIPIPHIAEQEENKIYDRITKALNKYHLHYLDNDSFDFIQSKNVIDDAMELTMRIDLKTNFNIKFHIIRDNSH